MFPPDLLLLVNLAATWFMVGVIWFVQVVHYPQFAGVGAAGFAAYHARHTRATTWVVAPPMLIELATAAALVVAPPPDVPVWVLGIGLALAVSLWISTAAIQIPQHHVLATGFTPHSHRALCRTNWYRTAAWTARGGLMLGVIFLRFRD